MCRVPAGFAHGFLVTSDHAEVQYKTTDYYAPEHERCIAWNDRDLVISWPLAGSQSPIHCVPLLSADSAMSCKMSGMI
jgi:dTDP-4-dehydrorhamnose 3,5-epimerase